MTEYKQAKLAFITNPSAGIYLLNVDDGKKFLRIQINNSQLGNLVADGAQMKLRTPQQ